MATKDKAHLEWHGRQWRVTVLVPKAARERIGKAHLKQSLNTHNLTTANLLKPPIVASFKSQIEEALREAQPATVFDEARAIRAARSKSPAIGRMMTITDRLGREQTLEVEEDDNAFYAIELAERLEERLGEDTAVAFAEIALGKATPLKEHVAAFLADHGYQPKSVLEMERVVRRLGEWLASTKRPQTLEAITPEVGTAFMRHLVVGHGVGTKNAGKYVSFLRSYWAWLIDHRHLPAHSAPWAAKLPKPKAPGRHSDLEPDEGKRPYRPEEMRKLLNGKPRVPALLDLIRLGALTGMRLEEIYRLRVRDVAEGFFMVRDGKTVNARRRVPVHEDLGGIVKRLKEGKEPGDYLVDPNAPVIEKTGLRSGAASKAFGYYRKSVGVDERPNGKLKSNIDFHSLRRWFIASARDGLFKGATGYNQWTIAEVAGHEDGLTDTLKMTMGLYAGASGDEALVACVAAVRLPQ